MSCGANSQHDSAVGECKCNPGYYATDGGNLAPCIPCPPGTFTTASGTIMCDACPSGEYQDLTGQTSCKACSGSVVCSAGTYISHACGGGFPGNCSSCPPCPSYATRVACGGGSPGTCGPCSMCPVNQYMQTLCGSGNLGVCAACDYTQCSQGYKLRHCDEMNPGVCRYVPLKFFSEPQLTKCSDWAFCPAGSYRSSCTGTACSQCPAGTYMPVENRYTSCYPCPRGLIQANVGQASCTVCGPGSYQPAQGASACLTCTGSVSNSISGSICCPGYEWTWTSGSSPVSGVCTQCPSGKYSNSVDEICLDCKAGSYAAAGSSACTTCASGQLVVGLSCVASCVQGYIYNSYSVAGSCTAGTFCSGSNYVNLTAYGTTSLSCVPMGSNQLVAYNAGSYKVTTNYIAHWVEEGSCMKAFTPFCISNTLSLQFLVQDLSGVMLYGCGCKAGYYVAYEAGGIVTPQACLSSAVASSMYYCKKCPAGSYSLDNDFGCKACPQGHMYDSISQSCVACSPGMYSVYNSQYGYYACEYCPAGSYATSVSQTYCTVCAPGSQLSSPGTCEKCPAGTSQPTPRQTFCAPCPTGTTSTAGSLCCEGYYSSLVGMSDGLRYTRWDGAYGQYSGTPSSTAWSTQISNLFTSGTLFAVEYRGYFYTSSYSGSFTFYTTSDDESYLWVWSGGTQVMVVNNGGQHGATTISGSITLEAYTLYPIMVHFSQNLGGSTLSVGFSNTAAGLASTTNGQGFYFYPNDGIYSVEALPLDFSCVTCPLCADGYYRSGCAGNSPGSCVACPSNLCSSGQYLSGCAGASVGSCKACQTCPSGTYLSGCTYISAGSCLTCDRCPPGQYASGCGGTSAGTCTACTSCPAGQYAAGCSGNQSGACAPCATCSIFETNVGCGGGSPGACQPCSGCPAGQYKRDCSSACEACATCGSDQHRQGCGGFGPGTCYNCMRCDPNYYNPGCSIDSAGSCEPCPACASSEVRMDCGGFGAGQCLPLSSFSSDCAGGLHYTNGVVSCEPCPPTSHTVTGPGGVPTCSSSPQITIVPPSNGSCVYVCQPGSYSPGDSDHCTACAAGTTSLTGSTSCAADLGGFCISPCPPDTYSTGVASSCVPCPYATYSLYGWTACKACIPGKRKQYDGSGGCPDCGPGTYTDTVQAEYCLQCPSGKFNNATGMSTCYDCDLVRRSRVNTSLPQGCACDAGYYEVGGVCEPCADGFYCEILKI